MSEKSRNDYIEILRETARRENRLPRKSDFSEYDVMKIKGFFGPWPWALEEAGLKESKKDERIRKNCEKRARAKRKRRENGS